MYKQLLLLVFVQILFSDCAIPSTKRENSAACRSLVLPHGRIRMRQKSRLAKFQCNSGYMIVGERYSSCVKGNWDMPPPVCVKPSCSAVKPPINGSIYPSHQGAVLNFYCKPGYYLRGATVAYCDGYKWSTNLPTCIPTDSEPALSCDFETDDLCGWSPDLNHDFDWRRQNYQTPSGHIGTGPKFDHTKGPGQNGYYVYIESSSRLENDTARLLSPIYQRMVNGFCFTFYYHMYGSTIGQLKVYVRKDSESYDTRKLKELFLESGNQGDVWKKGTVQIDSMPENFQIIIEGVRGKSYVSDIAVDDVRLTDFCPDETTTTTLESTTIIDLVSEFVPVTIDSCLNRCENASENNRTVNLQSNQCECFDSCLERNSCCPDFVAVCILENSDFTDDFTTETQTELSTTTTTTTSTIIKKPKLTSTTMKVIKPTKNITKQQTTEKTKTTKMINTTPKKPNATKPEQTTPQSTTTTTNEDVNPDPGPNQTPETMTDYEETAPPDFRLEMVAIKNANHSRNISHGSNLILALICLSIFGTLITISGVLIMRRYRMCARFRRSGNTDSMSDVRFLAGDEVLDFTWRSGEQQQQ